MSKTSGAIQKEPKNVLWTGRRVRPANGIHTLEANKPFRDLLTKISAVEKRLPKEMRISYAIQSTVIYLAITGTMTVEICKYLNFAMD